MLIALTLAISLSGCRGNLFAPDERSTPGDARVVQPYLVLLGPDGETLEQAWISIDSSLYRSGAGGISFRHDGVISQVPEAVEAPFSIEVRLSSPERSHLTLDVFPAEAETLVLKWPPPNFRIHLEWPAAFSEEEIVSASAYMPVRVDNRSVHLTPTALRTRWWGTSTELREGSTLIATLPATADSVDYARIRWAVNATDSTPSLSFEAETTGIALASTEEITVAATFVPLPLRAVWGSGAFELTQFDLTTSIARPDGSTEMVRVSPRRGMESSTRWGWPGEMLVQLSPYDQRALFPWREYMQWNGVDDIVVELGRHEFITRVVDAEGEPFRFVEFQLETLAPSWDSIQLTSGLDGNLTWFVNDGDYTLDFYSGPYATSPRGGPWRVDRDLNVTWVVP